MAYCALAIIRNDRVERQDVFCFCQPTPDGRVTHYSASWHVEKGLVDAVGADEEFGPCEDKHDRITVSFAKSLRIGDRVAMKVQVGDYNEHITGMRILNILEAEIKISYED